MLKKNILISIIALVILIIIVILIVVLTNNGKDSGTDNGKDSGTDITISIVRNNSAFVIFNKNSCQTANINNCFPKDILSLYEWDDTKNDQVSKRITVDATHIRNGTTIHKNKKLTVRPIFITNSLSHYLLEYSPGDNGNFNDGDIIRHK